MAVQRHRRSTGLWTIGVVLLLALTWPEPVPAGAVSWQSKATPPEEYRDLPAPGKKCPIDDHNDFTYEFTSTPKMGTAILRVRIFNAAKTQTSALTVFGHYGMPAMAGAHDSGDQEFKLNKRMDYLLPVTVAMPGEWEVRLTFKRDGQTVFRGRFRFNV